MLGVASLDVLASGASAVGVGDTADGVHDEGEEGEGRGEEGVGVEKLDGQVQAGVSGKTLVKPLLRF